MSAYERKTGPGYAYILCDICGRKIRQKDAVLITDRYNTHYGLLVCKHDVDKTNQQDVPFSIRETQVQNPKLLRSEPPDQRLTNALDDRVPSAPMNLMATLHPINNTIMLQWQGPQDSGSGPIIGYKVTIAEPQLAVQITLIADTGSTATYYEDAVSSLPGYYTYGVSAINTYGTGPESELAFYPNNQVPANLGVSVLYLCASQGPTILTGAGEVLEVNI